MVGVVRDVRSSYGYIDGEFQTFALDIGSIEYDINQMVNTTMFLNLSALKKKHVRSEKRPIH
jgi:hypothetical protein